MKEEVEIGESEESCIEYSLGIQIWTGAMLSIFISICFPVAILHHQ